jgi:hypothetical protein
MTARRTEVSKPYHNASRLFHDLCREHQLNWSERRALRKLANHLNVDPPALLFVQPECFSVTGLSPEQAGQLDRLRRRLFFE